MTNPNVHERILSNGVRAVVEHRPESASVAYDVFIDGGSRNEPRPLNGATHFVEHLLFKGTARHSVDDIARTINRHGNTMDASTSVENVRLNGQVLAEDIEEALALVASMIWESTMPPGEVERERGVILEEIAEYADSPEDLCWDNLQECLWGDAPLGRPILGTEESVAALARDAMSHYWECACTPTNVVVSLCGALEAEAAFDLADRAFGGREARPGTIPQDGPNHPAITHRIEQRSVEQVHFALGAPTFGRCDDRRFGLAVLDLILGGGPGSRLFQEVREKRGLAYSIGTTIQLTRWEGSLAVHGSTLAPQIDEVLAIIRDVINQVAANGPTEDELQTARRQVERSYLLSLDSNAFRASRNAHRTLYGERHITDAELLGKYECLGAADIRVLAEEYLARGDWATSQVAPRGLGGRRFEAG